MKSFNFFSYLLGSSVIILIINNLLKSVDLNFFIFYDLASFFFLIGGLILLFANFKLSEILKALKNSLSKIDLEKSEILTSQNVIESIWNKLLLSVIVLVITGIIQVASNLNDTTKIGPSLALILLGVVYTLTIKIFLINPMEISLKKKIIFIEDK